MIPKTCIYIFLILHLITINVLGQLNNVRIGAGIGESLYYGNQMDEKISFSTHGKSEVNLGYNLQVYKSINDKSEIGLRYLTTTLWSFKSANTLGLTADIKDLSIIFQRSFNDNVNLDDNWYTVNWVAGIGVCYFSSAFYDIRPAIGLSIPFSAVGYENLVTLSGRSIPAKQFAPIFTSGINFGVRLNKNLTLYFENSLSLSNTNKISGNLFRKSAIPPDGYFYTALTLYFNYIDIIRPPKITCPSF